MDNPILPRELDSVARTRVRKNSGDQKNDLIRRCINLIEGSNVTLTITDDSVNEKVNVTIAAAASWAVSSSAASVSLTGSQTGITLAAGLNTGSLNYSDAFDPSDGTLTPLAVPPPLLGLTYVLNSSTALVTATVDGVWGVSARLSPHIGFFTAGDTVQVVVAANSSSWPSGYNQQNWDTTLFGGTMTTFAILHLKTSDAILAQWQADSVAGLADARYYYGLDITRLA